MRIAYVEDNATNLALVERVATMSRHIIVAYSEGEIAASELLHEKFDLILMDVELAGDLGGLQVVRRLRESGLQTPIVAVTAYAMMGDREKCLEAGCNDYLPKPLPIKDLIAMLAKYDSVSPHPAEQPPTAPAGTVAPSVTVAAAPTTPASDGKAGDAVAAQPEAVQASKQAKVQPMTTNPEVVKSVKSAEDSDATVPPAGTQPEPDKSAK